MEMHPPVDVIFEEKKTNKNNKLADDENDNEVGSDVDNQEIMN